MAVKINSDQQHLSPLSVKFNATILDGLAKFTVTHDFYNDSKANLAAADFTFPLLPEFSILDFRCSFGGVPGKNRILRAVVLDREIAREEFELRLEEGKKTALLEQSSGDVFRSAVGNVPAEARIQTEITLAGFLRHCVRPDETIVMTVTIPTSVCHRYVFSPPEWKRSGQPLPPLGLSAELQIHTEDPKKNSVKLVSNHQEYTTFEKPTRGHRRNDAVVSAIIVVKIENKDPHQKGDVVLDIIKGPKHDVAQAWLEAHTTKSNYYAAMITLPKSVTQSIYVTWSGVKREIIFLADRSGSMAGERMEGLIKAMTVFPKGIPTDRYFNVWCFGSQHQAFWPKSVRYTGENLVYALERVKEFKADMGGTEIQPALEDIIRTSTRDAEASDVVVLTDGAVINDIMEATVQLVAKAMHDTGGRMRFFALGIGNEVSHALVTGVARAGGGMAAVLGAATEEHLGSVQVQVDAHDIVQPRQADLASLPAFSHNRIFMLFDPQMWKRGPASSITIMTRNPLRAIIGREIIKVHKTAPNTLIHKLAARAAIGDLERSESWVQLDPRGSEWGSEKDKELTKQEGVRLGREWNFVSKWTSFYLAESCYLGDSDPFLSTPPQSMKQNGRSSSISYDNCTSSAGSSSRHDKTLSSVSSCPGRVLFFDS